MSIDHLAQLPQTRRAILDHLKQVGPSTIGEIAEPIGISNEAVRQHLVQLEGEGWVESRVERGEGQRVGRPASRYRLTVAGDHLYPKNYDDLTVALIDAAAASLGKEAVVTLLSTVVDARVARWKPRLEGKDLRERVEALTSVYLEADPYAEVDHSDGELRLIERNCPFLNVAMDRPVLCSVTINTLSRLLGYRVVRERRFQDGHGRCVFRVLTDQPLDEDGAGYALEE